MLIRLIFVFLTLGCIGSAAQAAALSTVCSINFTPERGRPGTVVLIDVYQCYSDGPFLLQPGLFDPNRGEFRPIGKPLSTVSQRGDAFFSVTVTIPNRLPDGSHITNRGLTLRVTNSYGNDIAEGGSSIFTITSSDLPQTGSRVDRGWSLALLAVVLLLVGGLLSQKSDTSKR